MVTDLPRSFHPCAVRRDRRLFLGILTLATIAHVAVAEELPTIDEIRDAHNLRVGEFKSVTISWKGTNTRLTPEEIQLRSDGNLIVQGKSSRVIRDFDVWNDSDHRVERDVIMTTVFHSGVSRMYTERIHHGSISSLDETRAVVDLSLLSIALRPDPNYLNPERFEVIRREQADDGDMIVVGKLNAPIADDRTVTTRNEWHLDEDRDFLPVGYKIMAINGYVLLDAAVEYERDAEARWVPSAVRTNEYGGSRKRLSVTKVEFNTVYGPDTFELEFPRGTDVGDLIQKKNYTIE